MNMGMISYAHLLFKKVTYVNCEFFLRPRRTVELGLGLHKLLNRTYFTGRPRPTVTSKNNILQECNTRCLNTKSQCFAKQENIKNKVIHSTQQHRAKSTLYYVTAIGVLAVGLSYAAVPLYRMFCQAYSYGGTTGISEDSEKIENMKKVANRVVKIRFNADIGASMRWNFKPQQTEIQLVPGETALAFYTACNPTDEPVTGISTYNVVPFEAGQYFNKIQCFCFEEQLLNPHEQVDMPVFFYIDPEFAEDPKMELVDTITLSYTFFEAKEGMQLPVPAFAR